MVHSGGCSANDFRDVFKKNIEKRVRSLPEIDGLSKETVLSSWLAKYDAIYRGEEDFCKQPNRMALSAVSELILSKEQLYEMFQQILGIKKLEHQLIYNACQVSIGVTQFCCVQNICLLPPSLCVAAFSFKYISTVWGETSEKNLCSTWFLESAWKKGMPVYIYYLCYRDFLRHLTVSQLQWLGWFCRTLYGLYFCIPWYKIHMYVCVCTFVCVCVCVLL